MTRILTGLAVAVIVSIGTPAVASSGDRSGTGHMSFNPAATLDASQVHDMRARHTSCSGARGHAWIHVCKRAHLRTS